MAVLCDTPVTINSNYRQSHTYNDSEQASQKVLFFADGHYERVESAPPAAATDALTNAATSAL